MSHRPALKAACILAAGILLGKWISLGSAWFLWGTLLFVGLTLASMLRSSLKRTTQGLLAVLLMLAGAFRYVQENRLLPSNHIARFIRTERTVVLRGILDKDPVQKIGRTEIIFEAHSIEFADTVHSVCGKVLISFYENLLSPLQYGDEISVSGVLVRPKGKRNPGGFDYRGYLARQKIHVILKHGQMDGFRVLRRSQGNAFLRHCLYPVRRFALSVIDTTVSDPNSRALLRALVLGDQGMVSPELREDFSKTGVVHILSVSGSHVGFMYMILFMAFGFFRLPNALKTAATVAGLIFYALLTEASAPVVRATIMAVVVLVGTRIERKTDPYNILGVAALVILLWMPQDLFDPGCQLSFLSIFSIVYLYQKLKVIPPVYGLFQKLARYGWLKTAFAAVLVSLAAQIGTMPVTASYFNWIPLASIPANLIAIPLSGLIIAVSFTCLIIAPIHFWTASVYGAFNRLLLAVFIRTLDWIEKLPYSCLTVPSLDALQIILVFLILFWIFNFQNPKFRKRIIFAILFTANIILWKHILQNPAAKLTWIQFDVGQGDAALVRTPEGRTVLIDAGEKNDYLDCGERILSPFLDKNGIRKLDAVILTHPHSDHVGGLSHLIDHYKIGEIIVAARSDAFETDWNFLKQAEKKGIPIRTAARCDSLTVSRSVKIIVFNLPHRNSGMEKSGRNEQSLVTLIRYGNKKWLSMGDAGVATEIRMAALSVLTGCDALKVGHHGSCSSSSYEFLETIRPRHALISVGENNRFGHPCPEVIRRLQSVGAQIHRTDQEGAVILRTDGTRSWKVRWR